MLAFRTAAAVAPRHVGTGESGGAFWKDLLRKLFPDVLNETMLGMGPGTQVIYKLLQVILKWLVC